MRYALDASVALKWVLDEPDSPKARRLRDGFRRQVHELIAPDTLPVEVAHSLAKAERRGIIVPAEAPRLLAIVLSTSPQLHPYLPLLSKALILPINAPRTRPRSWRAIW